MSKNDEKSVKKESFEPLYTMQIPKLDNSDNFRIDKIIEEYKKKINTIAKIIMPEIKAPPPKNDLPSKNPDILAKLKYKKENNKNLLKINDAIIGTIVSGNPEDPKAYQNRIKRLAKGDTKFMSGVPQLKSKDGTLLNSPINKHKLEKYKTEVVMDLIKIDDSFENKITEKDILNKNNKEKEKESLIRTNLIKHNLNNKDAGFFLTGVAAEQEKKVEFFLENNNKEVNTTENILNVANHANNNRDLLKNGSTKSIANMIKNKVRNLNNDNSNLKPINTYKYSDMLLLDNDNFDKDSDLFSDENRYISITKKSGTSKQGKSHFKPKHSLGSWKTQENYNLGSNSPSKNFNFNSSITSKNPKESQINYALYKQNIENLNKLKCKENDFFKMALRTKSLKNLQNKKAAKKEKRFVKTNYQTAMTEFLSTVNTEMDYYQNTFMDIERGIKNYDHIQSVHWDIQQDKLSDKKMIYTDKEFVRKYFIYGTQGKSQFISENKENDNIIERSDNLAKITPEISYKFKNMIMNRFAEKPLVDFGQFLDRNDYKEKRFQQNSLKVAKLIDETDKRRSRIEKDLKMFYMKAQK